MRLLLLVILLLSGHAYAADYYVSNTGTKSAGSSTASDWTNANCYPSIQAALAVMSGGDTLILNDGTYTGINNTMVYGTNLTPPSGSAGSYTKIYARNYGQSIIDGESTYIPVSIYGRNYIHFDGIVFKNSSGSMFAVAGTTNVFAHHIKITRCGFADVPDTMSSGTRYNGMELIWVENSLVEDCYMWGSAKYFFYVLKSRYNILRRCVVRIDRTTDDSNQEGTYNTAAFRLYYAHDTLLQNCIVIDSDQNAQYVQNLSATPMQNIPHMLYTQGVFVDGSGNFETGGTTPKASNKFTGLIGLNNTGMMAYFARSSDGITENDLVSNSVFWGFDKGFWSRYGDASYPATFDNITVGNVNSTMGSTKDKIVSDTGEWVTVTDSILYNMDTALDNIEGTGTGNNLFYGNGYNYVNGSTVGATDKTTVDPLTNGLNYIPRRESASALSTGNYGAEILYQTGVTGTLYGESGYNTLTSSQLWPFPYESTIRTHMMSYSKTTAQGTIDGARGFCATGKTLTTYIWDYLGNSMPSNIYSAITASRISAKGSFIAR